MMGQPFRGFVSNYRENVRSSRRTYASAGVLELPDGGEAPAVVIFRGRFFMAMLTVEDATRLADELIDAIERPAC